ncbi:MAG: ABATE domain-containing protein [Solirubrobacteraceae bacterium]
MKSIAELPFIAGDVALDFVNTAEQRGHPEAIDVLRTPSDLVRWGRRYGLLDEDVAAGASAAELRRALDARELLYALFFDRVAGRRAGSDQLNRLAELHAAAYRAASPEQTESGELAWHWSRADPASIRHTAVAAAAHVLAAHPPPRLKQCPGDHCGWFFIDTTKRGNRRWCSMSDCGQDAKSAGRRARSAA